MKPWLKSSGSVVRLCLVAVVFVLSGGDTPLEPAVWLAPAILLRFVRDTRPWIGLPIALIVISGAALVADDGMLPLPAQVAVIVTVTGSFYALLPYAADRFLTSSLPRFARTLLLPVFAVAVETTLLGRGTWGHHAYGVQNIQMLQLTSVLGIQGIVFLVYWTASFLNEIWEDRSAARLKEPAVLIYLCVMLVAYGFGEWRVGRAPLGGEHMTVAGIVPPPSHRQVMMESFVAMASPESAERSERLRSIIEETFEALLERSQSLAKAGVELVLWSEGAVVIRESEQAAYFDRAAEVAREQGVFLGLGVVVMRAAGPTTGEPFLENKLVLIRPDGTTGIHYLKANLAPGMERQWSIPGDGRLVAVESEKGTITGAICYDLDFPDYIRQTGGMRADLMLAPSNDWPEIKETHRRMARMRAIENGVPILRPSSSGISTAIDQYGRILARVDGYATDGGYLAVAIPVGSAGTVYSKYGDSWTWACVVGALLLALGPAARLGMRIYRGRN